jgi:hypothetical protein
MCQNVAGGVPSHSSLILVGKEDEHALAPGGPYRQMCCELALVAAYERVMLCILGVLACPDPLRSTMGVP